MGFHWKVRLLGGSRKTNIEGRLPKKWLGQFANLGRLGKKEGWGGGGGFWWGGDTAMQNMLKLHEETIK